MTARALIAADESMPPERVSGALACAAPTSEERSPAEVGSLRISQWLPAEVVATELSERVAAQRERLARVQRGRAPLGREASENPQTKA